MNNDDAVGGGAGERPNGGYNGHTPEVIDIMAHFLLPTLGNPEAGFDISQTSACHEGHIPSTLFQKATVGDSAPLHSRPRTPHPNSHTILKVDGTLVDYQPQPPSPM